MMTATMLAQLGWLFHVEAEALLPDPYTWPVEQPTPEALAEAERLQGIASEVFDRADAAGFGADGNGTGTEAMFGYLVGRYR